MNALTERVAYQLCLGLGRLLRAGRYSTVRISVVDGRSQVRKRRLIHAPLLVAMGGPLVRLLDTGVRVLPSTEWIERERRTYFSMYRRNVIADSDVAILPYLPGETLAALLDDHTLDASLRRHAIELAVAALARFHSHGLTHGDAMAENVMVDLAGGTAHWFDFETVHDVTRPMAWRRADDVRALLATCLLRTRPTESASTLDLILNSYGDDDVIPIVASSFASAFRRPLVFHLGQAPLPYRHFREIGQLLCERAGGARETRQDATSS